MSRTQQLLSIGLLRLQEIAELTNIQERTIAYRIRILGIVPFERWWYNEHQLEMIINFEIYRKNE